MIVAERTKKKKEREKERKLKQNKKQEREKTEIGERKKEGKKKDIQSEALKSSHGHKQKSVTTPHILTSQWRSSLYFHMPNIIIKNITNLTVLEYLAH